MDSVGSRISRITVSHCYPVINEKNQSIIVSEGVWHREDRIPLTHHVLLCHSQWLLCGRKNAGIQPHYCITGANMRMYLLEKSCVVFQVTALLD